MFVLPLNLLPSCSFSLGLTADVLGVFNFVWPGSSELVSVLHGGVKSPEVFVWRLTLPFDLTYQHLDRIRKSYWRSSVKRNPSTRHQHHHHYHHHHTECLDANWIRPHSTLQIELKSEVYIHLSQIRLNSVFHNFWHLILVKIPCLRSVRITTLF